MSHRRIQPYFSSDLVNPITAGRSPARYRGAAKAAPAAPVFSKPTPQSTAKPASVCTQDQAPVYSLTPVHTRARSIEPSRDSALVETPVYTPQHPGSDWLDAPSAQPTVSFSSQSRIAGLKQRSFTALFAAKFLLAAALVALLLAYVTDPCVVMYPFYDDIDVDFRYLNVNKCEFYRDLTAYRKEMFRYMARNYAHAKDSREALQRGMDRNILLDSLTRTMEANGVRHTYRDTGALLDNALQVNVLRGKLREEPDGVKLVTAPTILSWDALFTFDWDTSVTLARAGLAALVMWAVLPCAVGCGFFYLLAHWYQREREVSGLLQLAHGILREHPRIPAQRLYGLMFEELVAQKKNAAALARFKELWPRPGVEGLFVERLLLDKHVCRELAEFSEFGEHATEVLSLR
ncbi:hypothetical protein DIPPA_35759 [Diplonema papillatum]|nr:hypothetical protein DIPPA_35759 [Diplonema papillatum]